MPVPRYHGLFNPTLQALRNLGGSASIAEIEEEVSKFLHLSDEEIAEPHNERRTKLEYRLAWPRTYLKAYGVLDNSERGVWAITARGKEVNVVDRAIWSWLSLWRSSSCYFGYVVYCSRHH